MMQSEEAVRRFLEGDDEAFNLLVRQWETRIYNLAWRFLGNREDAQDVVQETFLSVFRSVRNLREPRSFSTWLYRIALNHCRARWRSQCLDLSLDDAVPGQEGSDPPVPLMQFAGRQEQDALEIVDLIRKALAGLSEDHRSAIILKEYMGLSLEEVAAVMGCPLSTAKSRLYHGLRGVQRNLKRMGEKWGQPPDFR
jgi:RNA polymerase sigma-70 factor (ECF subfamily)